MACGALGAGLALTGPEPTVRIKEEKLKTKTIKSWIPIT